MAKKKQINRTILEPHQMSIFDVIPCEYTYNLEVIYEDVK